MLYLRQERGTPNIELSIDVIKSLPLTDEWEPVEDIIEKVGTEGTSLPSWRETFVVGKLADGEHVVLIFAKHADANLWERDSRWHLYVNGVVVWQMTDEEAYTMDMTVWEPVGSSVSTKQAMIFADTYIESDKMRFGVKFDKEVNSILQQYRKTCDAENQFAY